MKNNQKIVEDKRVLRLRKAKERRDSLEGREKNKEYRRKNALRAADLRFQNTHKISLEIYESLLLKQNHVCAICKQEEVLFDKKSNKVRRLAVDHDHQTGKIRGLLCLRCNVSLGQFNDSVDILESAIKYLKSC